MSRRRHVDTCRDAVAATTDASSAPPMLPFTPLRLRVCFSPLIVYAFFSFLRALMNIYSLYYLPLTPPWLHYAVIARHIYARHAKTAFEPIRHDYAY